MNHEPKTTNRPSCPVDRAKALHERVMATWAKYQALSLELLGLEGRVADCRKELTAVAKEIYGLYQTTDARLDGRPPAEG